MNYKNAVPFFHGTAFLFRWPRRVLAQLSSGDQEGWSSSICRKPSTLAAIWY